MSTLDNLKKEFDCAVNKNKDTAFALNYDLAEHPENSGQEIRSCKCYVNICRERGIEVEENFCELPTAFRAHVLRVKNPRYKMAILAEYDALPDLGHGCGHSASGALSLLSAFALKELGEKLQADIDLIGTPDEERRGEKIRMVQCGVFKDYHFAMMIHLNSNVTMPSLKFLALSVISYKFTGVPAHASANPWDGKNALNGAMLMLHAMDMLRQHVRPGVKIASFIRNGGAASNVVPEYAEIETCLRYTNKAYLDDVINMIDDCAHGAALATQTKVEKEVIGYQCTDMLLNENGIDVIRATMKELDVPFQEDDNSLQGSSDIANVSYECPTFHPMLATSDKAFSLHSEDMVRMVKSEHIKIVIEQGAKIIGYTILTLLTNNEVMQSVQEEFIKSIKESGK